VSIGCTTRRRDDRGNRGLNRESSGSRGLKVESVGVAIISVSRKYMVERASHPGWCQVE
jgi:hypothetical protein